METTTGNILDASNPIVQAGSDTGLPAAIRFRLGITHAEMKPVIEAYVAQHNVVVDADPLKPGATPLEAADREKRVQSELDLIRAEPATLVHTRVLTADDFDCDHKITAANLSMLISTGFLEID